MGPDDIAAAQPREPAKPLANRSGEDAGPVDIAGAWHLSPEREA